MAIAGLRLYLFFSPSPPSVDVGAHRELGRVLAAEAVQMAGAGGRIIVIGRETSEFHVPVAQAQVDAFRDAVRKAGRSVAVFRQVKADPLRTVAVPPAEFAEVLRQAKESDVIVSFLGPALLSAEQLAKCGAVRPKVLVVCPAGMVNRIDLPAVFDQKFVVAAVVSRPKAPAVPTGDARSAFEQSFKVIRQDNLGDLAALTGRGEEAGR